MEDLPPFWEEECLSGSIDHNPFPVPPQSLFEKDLFCNEDIDSPPDMNPESALDSLANDTFSTAVPLPQNFQDAIPSTPPQQPVPFAVSPTPSVPENSQHNSPWRSFFDDGCPLRRRVKVTITPLALGKRVPPPVASPKGSKKPRLSASPLQDQAQGSRLTQTKLRLPDPTEFPGRITLHVPYKSALATGDQPTKQSNKNANNLTEPHAPINDHLSEEVIDIESTIKETMGTNSNIELEAHSDLDEPFLNPISAHEAEETTVIPLYEQGHFLPFEAVEDPCAELSEIMSNDNVGNLPQLGHCLPEAYPIRKRTVPTMGRPARKLRACFSSDLIKRIANIAIPDKLPEPKPAHTDSPHIKPLVNSALQAISRAAQKYKSLINKVGSVQPAAAIVESLMNSSNLQPNTKSESREKKTDLVSGGKIGKARGGRRKGRRKRSQPSNNKSTGSPPGTAADGLREAIMSNEMSPLTRYINSQTRILESAS